MYYIRSNVSIQYFQPSILQERFKYHSLRPLFQLSSEKKKGAYINLPVPRRQLKDEQSSCAGVPTLSKSSPFLSRALPTYALITPALSVLVPSTSLPRLSTQLKTQPAGGYLSCLHLFETKRKTGNQITKLLLRGEADRKQRRREKFACFIASRNGVGWGNDNNCVKSAIKEENIKQSKEQKAKMQNIYRRSANKFSKIEFKLVFQLHPLFYSDKSKVSYKGKRSGRGRTCFFSISLKSLQYPGTYFISQAVFHTFAGLNTYW